MSTMLARQRSLLPALIAALVAASLLALPARAADPAARGAAIQLEQGAGPAPDRGSTQGVSACTLEVAASDEVWGTDAVVVPEEQFYLYGEGWSPGSDVDVTVVEVGSGVEEYYTLRTEPDGVLSVSTSFNRGFYGTFQLVVNQWDPACEAAVDLEVLPMADVATSKFLRDIKWLYLEGITSGCSFDEFCPNGSVTRGQMATFLSRALKLPATSTDYFTDDDTNKHEANINRLRAAGITVGCSATTFCPNGVVTRGQMASFLVRAFKLPTTSTDYFTDDETNKHEANINRLRAAGITAGCGGTRYCPDGHVTRGQMAAFIHRAMK